MKIKLEDKDYELNIARAIELGVLKEEKPQPKPGEVWQVTDDKIYNRILILNNNTYHCIENLNKGYGYNPTPIHSPWFNQDTSKKLANSLKEYYQKF